MYVNVMLDYITLIFLKMCMKFSGFFFDFLWSN